VAQESAAASRAAPNNLAAQDMPPMLPEMTGP